MGDLQLDKESANRFINSLSKSLQALCHGCMDFDAGIEIVGYINVNIDSGSKVDYVLNEKVMKSTTNSMTFVSNSFLAQKEQPKTCKDGSCSPIPELNVSSKGWAGSSYQASQLYRSSGIYSPHSQVLTGPQKRPRSGGDWRTTPRKYPRGAKSQNSSQSQHLPPPQTDSYSYSSEATSANSSQPSSYTSKQVYQGSEQQEEVNIKQEVEDGEDHTCSNHTTSAETENQGHADLSAVIGNIKADPDALPNEQNIEAKDNPLISQSKSNLLNTDNTKTKNETTGEDPENNFEDSSNNLESRETSLTADNNPDNLNEHSQGPSWADTEYEVPNEIYPQASYSGDISTGNSDGQFDIIEIDDEDEHYMYDDQGLSETLRSESLHKSKKRQSKGAYSKATTRCSVTSDLFGASSSFSPFKPPMAYNPKRNSSPCYYCDEEFHSPHDLYQHVSTRHQDCVPYRCQVCGKGYTNQSSYWYHLKDHQGKNFACSECSSKFKRKSHLKTHLLYTHNLNFCNRCLNAFHPNDQHDCSL